MAASPAHIARSVTLASTAVLEPGWQSRRTFLMLRSSYAPWRGQVSSVAPSRCFTSNLRYPGYCQLMIPISAVLNRYRVYEQTEPKKPLVIPAKGVAGEARLHSRPRRWPVHAKNAVMATTWIWRFSRTLSAGYCPMQTVVEVGIPLSTPRPSTITLWTLGELNRSVVRAAWWLILTS